MASTRRSTAFAALLLLRATLGAGQEATGDRAAGCPATVSDAQREEAAAALRAGQAYADAEDWPQAEERFRHAIGLDPADPLGHYGLGQALMEQKRYAGAVVAFEECRQGFRCLVLLPPEERIALERRRDAAIREIRDALRTLEVEALQKGAIKWKEANRDPSPSRTETSRRVRFLEERLGELEQWRRRGSLDPRPPAAVSLALGSAHFHVGALADAEGAFRDALTVEPRSGDTHNNLAVVLMLTGRLDEAEREVKLAEKAGVSVSPRLKDEIRKRRDPR